jgi:hypothetical protein
MLLRLVIIILLKLIIIVFFIAYSVRLVIIQTHFSILQLLILMHDMISAGSAPSELLINTWGPDIALTRFFSNRVLSRLDLAD